MQSVLCAERSIADMDGHYDPALVEFRLIDIN